MKTIELRNITAVGSLPYQADFSKHLQNGALMDDMTKRFDASVPGCIYNDLQKAGLIKPPYYAENSLDCEWVSGRWWLYRMEFTLEKADLETSLLLNFEGIDYSAQIYLNGCLLGRHEGMYIPFSTMINSAAREGENILVCALEHAPFCDPQPGYTSKTRYLKSRCNYKWDFAARLVSLGLYGDVTLASYSGAYIEAHGVRPMLTENGWTVEVSAELCGLNGGEAEIIFELNELSASQTKTVKLKPYTSAAFSVSVESPELWWPNGYGGQRLYDYSVTVKQDGKVCDSISDRIGFRTIEYRHADGRADALPYNVVINGKRVYLKGTNMVPLDCMTGAADYARTREILTAAKDANVNFLRIWGGGHIENEDYYSVCDELGLMILQEFTMSSSGCDDVPSRNREFLDLLQKAAVYNMKLKRNHVSLTFWDGGNELSDERYMNGDDHEGHPATLQDPTIALLAGLAAELTPDIMTLPTSGSGPNALLKKGDIGNNHDVHGPWGYAGVTEHYSLYNNSDSILHGEFGCGALCGAAQAEKIMDKSDIEHLHTSDESSVWKHHSGGWDSYTHREQVMFGDLRSLPLADYSRISQYIQFESLRYSLEANRRRQWKNVGEMTWQFNEPWPNIQCSNVLEYYGGRKLGFYALREAYSPLLVSLKYDSLFWSSADNFRAEIHIINDRPDADYTINCKAVSENGITLLEKQFCGRACEDVSAVVGTISFPVPENTGGAFSVLLETVCGKNVSDKEYLFLIADKHSEIYFGGADRYRAAYLKQKPLDEYQKAARADYKPVLSFYAREIQRNNP